MINKTILFISAGLEAVPAIQRAKQLGLTVIVSDRDSAAPGVQYADNFLLADTYNIEETLVAAKQFHAQERKIDGVICVAADVPQAVAAVATELGLQSVSLHSAFLAADKLAMKDQFSKDGVPIPWYTQVDSVAHLKQLVGDKGFPLVLKPVDSRGARGVLKLTAEVDLDWAFAESKSHSPSDRVMLESFLSGPQVSTESILMEGVAYTVGFADRNYELMEKFAPFIIENGGDLPSFLDEETQQAIRDLVQKAALSMGIDHGVVKGDIVVHKGKPYVIEMAARLSGGYFCTHEIPLNTGVDFVGAAIKLALGIPLAPKELEPKLNRYICQRYFFPEQGLVTEVDGVDDVRACKTTEFLDVRVNVGDVIKPFQNHLARGGMVITSGNSRMDALENAANAVNKIKIITQ